MHVNRSTLKFYLPAFFLLINLPGFAGIYRLIDSRGNPHYSDTAQNGSQSINLSRINSYSGTVNTQANETVTETGVYQKLAITSPTNQQTMQNQRDIPVTISLLPNLKKGDNLELWLDGNPYAQHSSTEFTIENIERGEHSIQAKILSSDGKVLKSSSAVTFFVHLNSKQS